MTPIKPSFCSHLPCQIKRTRNTKRVIEAIPLDKGEYRPEPVAKSALELAWHIVAAENRFLSGICMGKLDFTPNHRSDSSTTLPRLQPGLMRASMPTLSRLKA